MSGPAEGPRAVIATIPEHNLLELITGQTIVTNIPPTARIVAAWFDSVAIAGRTVRLLRIRVEDESFKPATIGLKIPRLKLQARGVPRPQREIE
jgi:hypothetical protein